MLAQGFLSACDHRFHFDCILSWARVTNRCPLCRAQFREVSMVDAQGAVVRHQRVPDATQVFRPDPQDHDVAAQLRLVSEARCQICGSGDDEHVLLMCEAPGCAVANHTYCAGLRAVPQSAWYCAQHAQAQGARAASDLIDRPATTVSTRRRTRRLATLMSNVLGGALAEGEQEPGRGSRRRGRGASNAVEGRQIRGAAAGYALRMSRELEMVQRRADAMFARGDLNQPALYESPSRGNRTRSTNVGASNIDQMWEDHDRSRREMISLVDDEEEKNDDTNSTHTPERNQISRTLLPEYRELEKLMLDAVSHDNYASSVALLIPKTAKLRLVSRVKAFFSKLNEREALKVLDLGCLSIIHKWVKSPDDSPPNPQVLDAILIVLHSLPIKKVHLEEVRCLGRKRECLR